MPTITESARTVPPLGESPIFADLEAARLDIRAEDLLTEAYQAQVSGDRDAAIEATLAAYSALCRAKGVEQGILPAGGES